MTQTTADEKTAIRRGMVSDFLHGIERKSPAAVNYLARVCLDTRQLPNPGLDQFWMEQCVPDTKNSIMSSTREVAPEVQDFIRTEFRLAGSYVLRNISEQPKQSQGVFRSLLKLVCH